MRALYREKVSVKKIGILKGSFAAALSAVLLILLFPPWEMGYLAWIALIPLILLIKRGGPIQSFLFALLAAFIFFCGLHYWSFYIEGFTKVNVGLANVINAMPYALFGLVAWFMNRRLPRLNIITLPAAWVLLEYARTHIGFLTWPLGLLAYSQYDNLFIARLSSFTGLYGVSFLILLSNVMLAEFCYALLWFLDRNRSPATAFQAMQKIVIGTIIVTVTLVFPLMLQGMSPTVSAANQDTIRVALVQGNSLYREKPEERDHAYRKAVFKTYEDLSRSAAEPDVELIVWPSSVVPGRIPYDDTLVNMLSDLAVETDKFLLVGSAGEEKFTNDPKSQGVSNSAFLISPKGRFVGRYDKMHLLAFDEYLPLRGTIKWPAWIASSFPKDYRAGEELTLFRLDDFKFGVQICWENYFPEQFRELAANGADFMVSMTNEEGFVNSRAGHDHFLAINVFRAIENNMPVVRTATSGITAVIHPSGKIVSRVTDENNNDVDVQGYIISNIPVSFKKTFYTRYGDWFLVVLAALFGGCFIWAVIRRA